MSMLVASMQRLNISQQGWLKGVAWSMQRQSTCGCTSARLAARHSAFRSSTPLLQQQAAAQRAAPTADLIVAGKQKVKTRKAAAKRFKVTAGGKVMMRHPGKQHINEKMSSKRLSKLGKEHVAHIGDIDNIKGCLPYARINKQKAARK